MLVLVVEPVRTGTMFQLEATMTSDIVPQCQKWQGESCWSNIHGLWSILLCLNISPAIYLFYTDITNDELCQTAQLLCQTLWNLSRESHERPHHTLITRQNFWFYLNSFSHEFLDLYFLLTIFSVTNQGHYEAVLSSSPLYCPHHEPSPGPGVQ